MNALEKYGSGAYDMAGRAAQGHVGSAIEVAVVYAVARLGTKYMLKSGYSPGSEEASGFLKSVMMGATIGGFFIDDHLMSLVLKACASSAAALCGTQDAINDVAKEASASE